MVETSCFIVHAIIDTERYLKEIEKELWEYGNIVTQIYLRGQLRVRSANYMVLVPRKSAHDFHAACKELIKPGLFVAVPELGLDA